MDAMRPLGIKWIIIESERLYLYLTLLLQEQESLGGTKVSAGAAKKE